MPLATLYTKKGRRKKAKKKKEKKRNNELDTTMFRGKKMRNNTFKACTVGQPNYVRPRTHATADLFTSPVYSQRADVSFSLRSKEVEEHREYRA